MINRHQPYGYNIVDLSYDKAPFIPKLRQDYLNKIAYKMFECGLTECDIPNRCPAEYSEIELEYIQTQIMWLKSYYK